MAPKKTDKEKIVKAANALFRKKGFRNTSMADIAAECSINKASLYHHYPSKNDLGAAVLHELYSHFKETYFNIAYDDSIPASTRMTKFTEEIEDFFVNREKGCLMGNLALEVGDDIPQFASILKAYFQEWINALAHILEAKYDKAKAKELATDAVSHLQGAIMLSSLYSDKAPIKRQRKYLIALMSDHPAAHPYAEA